MRKVIISGLVGAIGALVLVSGGQARRMARQTLVVALDGTFTSPATSSGTFVAGGAVSDTGTHHDTTQAVPPKGRPTRIVITTTCTGKKGSFTFVVTVPVAKAGFLSPGVSLSSSPGAARITKATGAYSGLVGAVSRQDLSYTSNPLQPGAPGTPKAAVNAVRVIDVFTKG
jgi:hypothetical protein